MADIEWRHISMPVLGDVLDVAPEIDVETWRLGVPAKPACYLLEDASGGAVLLATVANLRHALVTRLGPPAEDPTSGGGGGGGGGRIDYRAIIRRVRYRIVHNRFEANWAYVENARQLFPRDYRKLIRRFRAQWIGVDTAAAHPRLEIADRPLAPGPAPGATCFGPLPEARAARRYVEMIEDLFDLCRYHTILVQAPHGQACAYKQMGRCPAPCDGTISMEDYRRQIDAAVAFLRGDHGAVVQQISRRMKQAAAELKFELAARLKAQLEAARFANGPAAAHLRPLAEFRYLALQPGGRKGHVDAYFINCGTIELACAIAPKQRDAAAAELSTRLIAGGQPPPDLDAAATERIGLVSWHLSGGPREQGIYLHADDAADPQRIIEAIEELLGRKASDAATEEEAELDAITSDHTE